MFAARIVSILAGMASLPVVYARLGTRSYGIWAVLAGMVAIVRLADLGLGSAQIREVARVADGGCRRQARAVLGLGVAWGACLSALALTCTAICWPWLAHLCRLGSLGSPARSALLLLLAGFFVDSLAMPWRAVLEGTQSYAAVARASAASTVAGAALAVGVVELGGGLVALAASTATTSVLAAAMFVRSVRRSAPELAPTFREIRRADVSYAFAYGSRIQLANVAGAVNSEMDRLVLTFFFGPPAVAGYDIGSRLVGQLRLPTGIILTALFPAASRAAREPDRLDRLYIAMTRYLAVFTTTGAAVLMVSAYPLVRLWLARPMPAAARAVEILAPGCAVAVCASAAAVVTRAEGRPGRETRSGLLAAGLNLLLTYPLLRLIGPSGVLLSTTLAAVGATGYFFVHFHRSSHRPIGPLLCALWPPTLAAAIAGAITEALAGRFPGGPGRTSAALAVAWQTGLIVLLAAVLLAAFRYFDGNDRSRLRAVITQLTPRRIVAPAMVWRNR
ncbi:oligosaccharide flippase family protein [Actinocrinis puniceicyclus]|uniref:oligosaccharide flippase family protein n=1 Tax=Actinocrinis puniceicyclus TaxID=977794 RepID=UPI001B8B036C|nr:oligosaccharide flippase family protein [Actinocrinis puniceicyclus]